MSSLGPARRTRPTLLVLRALGLGDFLTGIPAYRALRRAFPDHYRVLACSTALAPLVPHAHAFDALLPTEGLRPIAHRPLHPAFAVNLHGSGPESHRVLTSCAPGRLIAFAHPDVPESRDGPVWEQEEHEVTRWCRLLTAHGIPADPTDLDVSVPVRTVPPYAVGATLIHPGAGSVARRWPLERWIAIARAERAAGRTVIVTGGPAELSLAGRVSLAAGLSSRHLFAGKLTVLDLASLVAAAGRVVCGDTGVAHLAIALHTPSVVLYGPTAPSRWGPPPNRPWHRVLWAGRCGDPHGSVVDRGLLAIAVDDVVHALAGLPEKHGP